MPLGLAGRRAPATEAIAGLALGAALVALGLAAPAATAHQPRGATGGEPIASQGGREEMIAARTRFFGAANVDPRTGAVRRDSVILSWFGVTNFAMAIRGQVVLLDAWVPRGAHSGYVPASPEELARLRPELILIGHAHFDHAADAVPIALATGATLVGTAEHCAALRVRADDAPPSCIEAIAAGAPAGTMATPELLRGVRVRVVKHLHSAVASPDLADGFHVPVLPFPSTTPLEHPPTPDDLIHLLGHLPDDEGGTLLYRFRVGDLSLVWHDSAGPLVDRAPEVLDVLRALRPVGVQLGAIQGFNQVTNGMRDPISYIDALEPEIFVPTHHDDWAFGITTRGERYRPYLAAALAGLGADRRPRVRFIVDPDDYVNPEALTFPVRIEPPRLALRCRPSGRLRAVVRGDVADVRWVRFRLRGVRARRARAAPFRATFGRRAQRVAAGRRIRAVAREHGGERRVLVRRLRACAR